MTASLTRAGRSAAAGITTDPVLRRLISQQMQAPFWRVEQIARRLDRPAEHVEAVITDIEHVADVARRKRERARLEAANAAFVAKLRSCA